MFSFGRPRKSRSKFLARVCLYLYEFFRQVFLQVRGTIQQTVSSLANCVTRLGRPRTGLPTHETIEVATCARGDSSAGESGLDLRGGGAAYLYMYVEVRLDKVGRLIPHLTSFQDASDSSSVVYKAAVPWTAFWKK